MCVLYTADVGGILTLQFDEDGNLQFQVTSADDDFLFDEIGSVLKIKQYQADKQELLEALELYYRIKILGEKVDFVIMEDSYVISSRCWKYRYYIWIVS